MLFKLESYGTTWKVFAGARGVANIASGAKPPPPSSVVQTTSHITWSTFTHLRTHLRVLGEESSPP